MPDDPLIRWENGGAVVSEDEGDAAPDRSRSKGSSRRDTPSRPSGFNERKEH
jgi:hypothetical protein